MSNGSRITEFTSLDSQIYKPVVHTNIGFLQYRDTNPFYRLPYGVDYKDIDNRTEIDAEIPVTYRYMTYQDGLLFMASNDIGLAEIRSNSEIKFLRRLNIDPPNNMADIAIYRDTLYILQGSIDPARVDIRKYRPLRKNTKTTINVQFATAGDKIDLTQCSPERGRSSRSQPCLDEPSYLSINASNELVIDSTEGMSYW